MITNFNVRKEILSDTVHERLHFEITSGDKKYEGYYKDGEIDWFQMQPDEMEDLDVEVRKRMMEWESTQ